MINNSVISEIDRLHSECSGMDKMTKFGYLTGKKLSLIMLDRELANSIRRQGSILTPEDKVAVQKLSEMMAAINEEGANTSRELVRDSVRSMVIKALSQL